MNRASPSHQQETTRYFAPVRASLPRPYSLRSSTVTSLALPSGPIMKLTPMRAPGVSANGAVGEQVPVERDQREALARRPEMQVERAARVRDLRVADVVVAVIACIGRCRQRRRRRRRRFGVGETGLHQLLVAGLEGLVRKR